MEPGRQHTGYHVDSTEDRDRAYGHDKGVGINPESWGVKRSYPRWIGVLQSSLVCAGSKICRCTKDQANSHVSKLRSSAGTSRHTVVIVFPSVAFLRISLHCAEVLHFNEVQFIESSFYGYYF